MTAQVPYQISRSAAPFLWTVFHSMGMLIASSCHCSPASWACSQLFKQEEMSKN